MPNIMKNLHFKPLQFTIYYFLRGTALKIDMRGYIRSRAALRLLTPPLQPCTHRTGFGLNYAPTLISSKET